LAHNCKACLVLDTTGGSGNGLAADYRLGLIKVVAGDPNPQPTSPKPRQINQYCAFIDKSGYLYAFVQAEDRIIVRRSHDIGDSWMNLLPEAFSFIPAKPGTTDAERIDGEAPFCMYDSATDNFLMFFFHRACLLFSKFPAEALRDTPDTASRQMSLVKPMVLVGRPTKDMTDRGITASTSVEDIRSGEVPPVLSPHRVAAIKTAQGYYRVFYKDDENKLKSLISKDNGGTWLTERQSQEIG
jgi:hypothetical protein